MQPLLENSITQAKLQSMYHKNPSIEEAQLHETNLRLVAGFDYHCTVLSKLDAVVALGLSGLPSERCQARPVRTNNTNQR